ncbi:BURP domain-containing protein 3 isoform X2 [Ricinus communis]|uniref:Polygalacturonase, putative n=1 Tax=Ricinus communis TaxID=3988 RepID=B9RKR7_RICCO|nr:BURP domain-containing protein 3 isoform X2 [Ricinus communis]EEF48265.1 polygalacturonase, putative [Ricinus communis]|eukprot:XP_002514311.1 BURP domain-containing protein 3 [Ricinus communis]
MEFHFLVVLFLTSLQLAKTHAVTSQEIYWQSMLPTTLMPKVLHDLLPSEQKSDASMNFEDSGVDVDVGNIVSVDIGNGVTVDVEPPFFSGASPFLFNYGASRDELHSNQNVTPFFLDKDLHPGTKMNVYFTKIAADAKFLPRKVAKIIPFSSNKFSEIMRKFLVKPNSTKAEIMKKTMEECEEPAFEDEDKYCATSLEAMVDFSTSKLGKDVRVLVTKANKDDTLQQEFSITQGVEMVGGKLVACHAKNYIYPVFYCHETHITKAYIVPLIGDDKTRVQAVAICHTDTSKWNPMHLAFQVLDVKPGTVPICHFLPENHIIWVTE